MKRALHRLCLVAFFALAAHSARAAVAFTNVGTSYSTSGATINSRFTQGYAFTSSVTGELSLVSIAMTIATGTNSLFNLELFADNAGSLGSTLWTGSGNALPNGTTDQLVSIAGDGPDANLVSGQTYWLLASSSTSDLGWRFNTIGNTGPYYYHDSLFPPATYFPNNTRGAFEIQVSVPEPSRCLLLGCGCLFAAMRRRRARQA
jgi:hypothetical protein